MTREGGAAPNNTGILGRRNESPVNFTVEAVLVSGGLLTFTVRSGGAGASGGDAFTVRLWKQAAYVSFAHVRDNFDGTYSAWAKVPEAGMYFLTVIQDWPSCSGLREDGLRPDSMLGFQVVNNGRLRFDQSDRVALFKKLEGIWPYSGRRTPDVTINVTAEQVGDPDDGDCDQTGHVLAPGYYALDVRAGDLRGRWVPNECRRRRCISHALPLSADLPYVILVGDSTSGQVKECMSAASGAGPCGSARFNDTEALARGISPAMRSKWETWRVWNVRYDGLEKELERSINKLEQLEGWLCNWPADRPDRIGGPMDMAWAREVNKPIPAINDAIRRACSEPHVPQDNVRTPLVIINCGAHCVYRTPFRVFTKWIDAAAEVMKRIQRSGLARFAYKTSAAIHESAFHYSASDPPFPSSGVAARGDRLSHDAKVFNQRHWRLTDARIRVFDGYAATVMEMSNITVLDHWSPSRGWPKIRPDARQEPAALKFPSTHEASSDMRHHATETLLGAMREILEEMSHPSAAQL